MRPAPRLPGYAHVHSGKVRDLYAPLDADTGEPRRDLLLLVASDRISAFDHVLEPQIPDKGRILTQLSLWWFERFADVVDNHVVLADAGGATVPEEVQGRALLVRRLRMLPVECIGRAYLTGSGLAEYRESGSVCGVALPPGLTEAARLEQPVFTPTTKAPIGEHDAPMTYAQVEAELGPGLAARVRDLTTTILARGGEIAAARGILIADTKVEFGLEVDAAGGSARADPRPRLLLADEVLTPDSSRFWPADDWAPGRTPRSYDKQYVRDWLTSADSGWHRAAAAPPPPLPADVVAATRRRYIEAYERLTGTRFA